MPRPYYVRIEIADLQTTRRRGKVFKIPEGVVLDNQKLVPVGQWLMGVVDALDADFTDDGEEDL